MKSAVFIMIPGIKGGPDIGSWYPAEHPAPPHVKFDISDNIWGK